ncbi:MAG: ribulose-phosphate 3-epimerase [Alphaproteobacteria bacterium]|nr:ribulose-phosphate 3-epimerase [Alphaproteobacteria bacterium]
MSKTLIEIGIATADFYCVADVLRAIESSGADGIHLDIMDGNFVGQITYGAKIVSDLRRHSSKRFDVHLMVENPLPLIGQFKEAGADIIHIHAESKNVGATLDHLREHGIESGIAVRLETPLEKALPYLDYVSSVILMCAETGYSGMEFNEVALARIAAVRAAYPGMRILVDGGMNFDTAKLALEAGADGIISGSFLLAQKDLNAAIERMR